MSSRPYRCPACQRILGTIVHKGPRGQVCSQFVAAGRWVEMDLRWHGSYLRCPCGKRTRLSSDVQVVQK